MFDQPGVLALVPDDWSVAPQRRHQILSRLAMYLPVAWISPAFHWRSWLHSRTHQPTSEQRQAPPGARMFALPSAHGLPTVHHPRALWRAVARSRAARGARWLERSGCRAIELQIWLPEYADALDWVPHTTSSYHIDDEYSWSTDERPLSAHERRLIERVDRVFVSSPKLLETKGGINANTIFSPNGVDYAAFSARVNEPADLARIPRPRIGYVGVLKEQLNWELIAALAAIHPSWSFVLVGPVRATHDSVPRLLATLQRLPNVHVIGARCAEAIPGYLQGMDAVLLPYRRNAYTDCINPIKLYETLAAGTPIVASRIRTLQDFASVVTLAGDVTEWSAGIANVLTTSSTSVARRADGQAIARAHDWDVIVAAMAESITPELGEAPASV